MGGIVPSNHCSPFPGLEELVQALMPSATVLFEQTIFPMAQELDPTDTGGWFTVWGSTAEDTGLHARPLFGCAVGNISAYKMAGYQNYAIEKAQRLAGYSGHLSSWQSREVSRARYGGAIRTDSGLILSFSGLAEHFDELGVLLVANNWHLVTSERRDEIIRISDNGPAREFFARS